MNNLLPRREFPHTAQLAWQHDSSRRPELDLLRLIFFSMVFIAHIPRFPHLGWVMDAGGNGVCFFFMLSAFLITDLLSREWAHTRSVRVGSFLARRTLRILPLYFLVILLGTVAGFLIPSLHVPTRSLPWLLSFTYNFYIAHHGWDSNALGPLWSLSIEWQFYLAIPWIVKIGGRRALGIFSAICVPASYAMLLSLGHAHAVPSTSVWVNSIVQFQFFALGIALALYLHGHSWKISIFARVVLMIGGTALLAMQQRFIHLHQSMPLAASRLCCGYLLVVMCGAMVFLGLFNWPLPIPRSLLYLGEISYGLYVYHTLFLLVLVYRMAGSSRWNVALGDASSLTITILTAHVSYQYFEKPFLRLKKRLPYRSNAVAQLVVPVPGKSAVSPTEAEPREDSQWLKQSNQ